MEPDTPFTACDYDGVTVLHAANGGVVPYGNTVVVRGRDAVMVVDPSLAMHTDPVGADLVMISHAHEDHLAGLRHFTADVHAHEADAEAVGSLDAMLAQYVPPGPERDRMEQEVREVYGLDDGPGQVHAVRDGHVFDLGGGVTATVVALPGHTPGHSGLLIEPAGFLYVADIDLTSFGPMYGDLHSSVDDFLASFDKVEGIEARWYGTFHHKGVVDGSADFRRRLGAYRDKLLSREDRLLSFLAVPHSLADIVEHRLVYRPHVQAPWVVPVERRTAELHLERLLRAEQIVADDDGRYRAL
ncbi:MBL fold metallo-hydrolase [Gordonia sp. VNK21]|uniref:MBL fold metallo-hydrolase n=2 Tax=Gordonia sp. VNK21 TaxID=3382483 RepID=UPI0038D36901